MINFFVSEEENKTTLISFIKKYLKKTPLSLIYKLFRKKKIKVNNQIKNYYHYRLKKNEKIEIFDNFLKIDKKKNEKISKEKNIFFEIIYEDDNIFIIIKEHNVDIEELNKSVNFHFYQKNQNEYEKNKKNFFYFNYSHRIDKLVKGLVIYTKKNSIKKIFHDSINNKKKIIKKYLALCKYSKKIMPKFINGYIEKNDKEMKMFFSLKKKSEKGKYCSLEINKKIEKKLNFFKKKEYFFEKKIKTILIEITLDTGRKHQIRSILSYLGFPIIGDKKYGSKIILSKKICLIAYKLEFDNFSSPLSYLNKKKIIINN